MIEISESSWNDFISHPTTAYYDYNVFRKRLDKDFKNPDLVEKLIDTHRKYEFVIGLIDSEIEEFFDDFEDYFDFVNTHNLKVDMGEFDYGDFESLLVRELSITSEEAERYIACDEAYMRDLGLM